MFTWQWFNFPTERLSVKSKWYNIQFVNGTLKLTRSPGEIIFYMGLS